jgi:hypothetical protein
MRVLLLFLLAFPALAQVTSTRETSYDFACCENAACSTFTTHQRLDSAYTACLNRSIGDGQPRWVQGGRWRVSISIPRPPANPYIPPTTGAATLNWTAPTTRSDGSSLTNLAGYRIRYGNALTDLRYLVEVANPAATSQVLDNLTAGTWYFTMTAYDVAGIESVQTNPVSKVIQ